MSTTSISARVLIVLAILLFVPFLAYGQTASYSASTGSTASPSYSNGNYGPGPSSPPHLPPMGRGPGVLQGTTTPVAPIPGSGTTPGVCPQDAHQCADGSWVGRTGPNCTFVCQSEPGGYGVNTGNAVTPQNSTGNYGPGPSSPPVLPPMGYGPGVPQGNGNVTAPGSGTQTLFGQGTSPLGNWISNLLWGNSSYSSQNTNGSSAPDLIQQFRSQGTVTGASSGSVSGQSACPGPDCPVLPPNTGRGACPGPDCPVVHGSASLASSPTSGPAPLTVTFSASSLTASSTYIIDYGDGANSGPVSTADGTFTANHTYDALGTYHAVLQPYYACMWSNPRCMMAAVPLATATVVVTPVGYIPGEGCTGSNCPLDNASTTNGANTNYAGTEHPFFGADGSVNAGAGGNFGSSSGSGIGNFFRSIFSGFFR